MSNSTISGILITLESLIPIINQIIDSLQRITLDSPTTSSLKQPNTSTTSILVDPFLKPEPSLQPLFCFDIQEVTKQLSEKTEEISLIPICKYHRRFGDKALKCTKQCRFTQSNN